MKIETARAAGVLSQQRDSLASLLDAFNLAVADASVISYGTLNLLSPKTGTATNPLPALDGSQSSKLLVFFAGILQEQLMGIDASLAGLTDDSVAAAKT